MHYYESNMNYKNISHTTWSILSEWSYRLKYASNQLALEHVPKTLCAGWSFVAKTNNVFEHLKPQYLRTPLLTIHKYVDFATAQRYKLSCTTVVRS